MMQIKGDKFEIITNGIKINIYPEHIKEQAVRDLEKGVLSIKESMEKYGISKSDTIKKWLKKYSVLETQDYMRPRSTPQIRRQILREIDGGKLSIEEAVRKYHFAAETIKNWERLGSLEIINESKEPDMGQKKDKEDRIEDNKEKDLQKTIEYQKLKILALETLIDVAEKELKIDIRKKSGTRQ